MEQPSIEHTATRVRECRASNQVFGLREPEKWSEHKQLVDFIDDIFSPQRRSTAKFMRPVRSASSMVSRYMLTMVSMTMLRAATGNRRR